VGNARNSFHARSIIEGAAMAHNVLRIREGYEAEPLALGSFLLYAVIGCPSFGINNNLNK
jgi:hypothetical protein